MNFKPIQQTRRLTDPAFRYVRDTRPAEIFLTEQVMFTFKPGVGEQDVRRAVEYYVHQTNLALTEAGKKTTVEVESIANYGNGQVLIKGKAVGSIAEWVMLPTTPKPPPPPPPWIPDDITVDVKRPATRFLKTVNRGLR